MKNENYEELFKLALNGEAKTLKAYSNFHNYSFGNQMYAMAQMLQRGLEISPIGTFKKWKSLGRSVTKGQKALELCMPVTFKNEEGEIRKNFVWRKLWFAYSQTNGKDLEFPAIGFDYDKALKQLGITKTAFEMINGNAQGYAQKGKKIAINPVAEMPEKTFFHEVGHVLLGHCDNGSEFVDDATTERSLQEVEAESVALCCMLALGVSGIEYPRGYIKNWWNDKEIPADSIKKIFRVTNEILRSGQEKPAEAIDKE